MEINGIWMVEWPENYLECNAAFTERKRAMDYIEAQARRLGLYDRGFNLVDESLVKNDDGEHTWGIYAFLPEAQFGEVDTQFVNYAWYTLNPWQENG